MHPCRLPIGCALFASLWATAARAEPVRVLQAAALGSERLTLDGKLDEAVWQTSQMASEWVERTPVPQGKPPVRTELRILYDEDALYVGVRAELEPGDVPRADTLVYDNQLIWSDESITLKFDTRLDHRTTVGFAFNPAGAQLDFLAVENGQVFRDSYDAIWTVRTQVGEGYWSAEVRIPTIALGLPPARGARVIGFNAQRTHNARNATYDWAYLAQEFSPYYAVNYGELRGVQGVAAGHPLTLLPYGLIGYQDSDPYRPAWKPKLGGDVRVRMASDTWAELTAFTDFAQVNLDDQVINLDRFPITYPEQRPFFLTGLDVFAMPGSPELLNTRTIGLDAQAQEVPILAGGKVYGNEGPFSFGALGVLTDDTLQITDPDTGAVQGVPARTSSAVRGRANFGRAGHLGLMSTLLTNVDLPAAEEVPMPTNPNVAVGSDLLLRGLNQRLELAGFGAFTHDEQGKETTEGASTQARLTYLGEMWRPTARATYISDDFHPALGFIPRTGIFTTLGALPWIYNTSELGLQNILIRGVATYTWSDEVDRLLKRELNADVVVKWANGWGVDFSLDHVLDVVDQPFEVVPNVEVQPDSYEGFRIRTALYTPANEPISASLYYRVSQAFFSGLGHGFSATTNFAFNRTFRYTAGWVATFFTLRDCIDAVDDDGFPIKRCGNLAASGVAHDDALEVRDKTLAFNSSLIITPSTTVTGTLTFQVNTVTEETVGLARIGWRYVPGSELFLVYQQTVDYSGPPTSDHRVALKMNYRYDTAL